jgi:hypothetical protein
VRHLKIFDLAEALEDFLPVKFGVEFPEGSRKVVDAPGHLSLFVFGLLLNGGAGTRLVRFKSVVHYLGNMVILTLVVDGKVEYGLSHALLVDIFKLTKYLDKEVVLVRAAVANVDEYLPRLKNLVNELKMLQAAAFSQDVKGWQFKIAVYLTRILMQVRSQGCKLAEFTLQRTDEIVFNLQNALIFDQKID